MSEISPGERADMKRHEATKAAHTCEPSHNAPLNGKQPKCVTCNRFMSNAQIAAWGDTRANHAPRVYGAHEAEEYYADCRRIVRESREKQQPVQRRTEDPPRDLQGKPAAWKVWAAVLLFVALLALVCGDWYWPR